MKKQFNDDLLDKFARSFYGYGNYSGNVWFVGIEEGGGNSFEDIEHRLKQWSDRGQKELDDLPSCLVGSPFAQAHPPVQPTWNKLIRILLCRDGEAQPTLEQVRHYQPTALGREDGNHCLLELRPLPSPNIHHWLYAKHSALPYVVDRGVYNRACLEWRIPHLQQRIREYQPRVVLFYGAGCWQEWEEIARVEWSETFPSIYTGRNRSTLFFRTPHTTARGLTNAQFHQIGQLVRAEVNRL